MGAQAIGLGKLKVHSALDEPLNAEIPFTALSKKERRKLKALLASRAEFDAAGIDRPAHLADIKFSVAKRVDGSYFLQLTTENSFRDPFLHLLVKVQWTGGRLIREYSALIDPPYLVATKPTSVAAPITAPAPIPTRAEPVPVPNQWQPTAPRTSEPVMVGEVKPQAAPKPVDDFTPVPVPESVPEPVPVQPVPEPVPEIKKAAPAAEFAPVPMEPVESLARAEPMPDFPDYFGPNRVDNSRYQLDPRTGWPVDPDEEAEFAEAMTEAVEPAKTRTGKVEKFEPVPFPSSGSYGSLVPGSNYRVVRGDTMWEIAEQVRGSRRDISVEQVVMAIYQANQGAFFGKNVNNLSAGRVIDIPDESRLVGAGKNKARNKFVAHYDVWQEYRLKAASAQQAIDVAEAPKAAKPEPKSKADGKAAKIKAAKARAKAKKAKAKKPAAPAKPKATPADDLLRIVRSDIKREKTKGKAKAPDSETKSAKAEKSALAERVASLEESLESTQMQTKESAERAGKVKEQLDTQKRLIELENESLARPKPAKPAAKKPDPAAAKKPAPKKLVKKPAARKPAPKPQPEQANFFEDLLNSFQSGGINFLIIIGVVTFLVVSLGGLYWKRRRAASLEFEESILNSTMDSDVEMTGDSGAEGDSGDTSFLSDFSQGGMGNIATDEVDPIAEADVYLAYGRDEQAEEILREAIVKDPSRYEVHEKLLEIYHSRGDASAFETVAEELYATLGGQGGELWDRVAEMGKKINPDNPMFSGGAPPPAAAAPAAAPADSGTDLDMGDDDLFGGDDDLFGGMEETPAAEQPEAQPTQMLSGEVDETLFDSEPSADDGLQMDGELADTGLSMDGDLDIGGDLDSVEESGDDDGALDFNMDFSTDDIASDDTSGDDAASAETVVADGSMSLDDGGLDFSLDDSGSDDAAASDSGGLSLDDGGLDFSLDDAAGEEEVAASDDGGLEFSLDDSLSTGDEPEADAGGLSLEADDGGVSFDVDEGELDVSGSDDGGLDFDLEAAAANLTADDGGLDFGIEEDDAGEIEPSFDVDEDVADAGASLDFSTDTGGDSGLDDFGDAADGMEASMAEDTAVATAESEDSQQWDETATKLDLAKAYIDMGDADGARSILDEVMTEGNDSQKQQAEDLIAQIT
ncbi:MAG: hypothetical protein IME93_01580 [Proteobacteria bacterium]|nr:hypothetical protein [Pseudomonadota bacterium]